MTLENGQPKSKRTNLPRLAMRAKTGQPVWGMCTPQLLRDGAYQALEAYGIADKFPDKGDYTCMIEGLEAIQMVNSFVMQHVPEPPPGVRKGRPHKNTIEVVDKLRAVLMGLRTLDQWETRYRPEFCTLCYCHRDQQSAHYCLVHKPVADDKKAYQHGKRRFEEFLEVVIARYNDAIDAKKIPHGLDMVLPQGFNYENIVQMLSAFPLANAKLLPVVEECFASDQPVSGFNVLARIYEAALDPDGVDLVRRVEASGQHQSFRSLQDLMHFVSRYEAYLLLKNAAPKARGPKVRHSADHIRAVVAASPGKSMTQLAKELGCSRDTLYKALKEPQFPTIDVLQSTSRLAGNLATDDELSILASAVKLLVTYQRNHQMGDLGAYRAGSDPTIDRVLHAYPALRKVLCQSVHASSPHAEALAQLRRALGVAP